MNFKDTSEIKVPDRLIDQVIGQDEAVKIIKKAASQKRNVLLVGEPGTGKSLLANAMANVMPVDKIPDILVYPNEIDSNVPIIRIVDNGDAKKTIESISRDEKAQQDSMKLISFLIPLAWFIIASILWQFEIIPDVVYAATIIVGAFLIIGSALSSQIKIRSERMIPKLLIDNSSKNKAPFIDATGARAGSLFGDVKHDPLQSGGLGTPPHLRVVPGMIHRANKGVLFIDEVATLSDKSQQDLLTAMQEKKMSITGQSDMSSGAMVRTEPAPCDFVLVAAGNYQDLERLHPALRSRIRGYGYEVYMNKDMDDNEQNRELIAQFVAQEIQKDGKIPHFTKDAVEIIVFEARKMASSKNKLTLRFRELGGLIRASGDLAKERNKKLTESVDVLDAKNLARTLEEQMISKHIDLTKDYKVFSIKGESIGKVNGLAVLSDMQTGTIIPIEAEIAPAQSKNEGKIIATGKLGEIAKEAVSNLSAIIKKIANLDLQNYDIHIQFLQTYSGVEGDSASISVTTSVISAIEKLAIDQTVAMTGSLSVKGEVLPVGGVSAKVRAAIKAGFKKVIIPYSNLEDLVLLPNDKEKIEVIGAKTLYDVLKVALVESKEKTNLIRKMKKVISE